MLQTAVPILASLNAEETIQFYTQQMGFTFHNNWDGYLIFSRDEIQIHLWPTSDEDVPKNTGCYVNVTEVDLLYAEYQAKALIHPNGKLESKPWGMRQFSILDNNGNIIHFGEDISKRH
ncbi:bleomycin resistance protein [Nubsella zeaxanthinifaciens]|uniref:bleomycin resistance protein n=1 Tax=Nubsella zeaxanthinifaciens TaxID=392412 RepID=UPI000DE3B3D5|nr:VOC family protein [Nubsella zeaxanthinifaciens]